MNIHSTVSTTGPVPPATWVPKRNSTLPIEVRIRCDESDHRVVLQPGGALILPDHTRAHIRMHCNLATIGGEPCECVALLHHWQRAVAWRPVPETLPPLLETAARVAASVRQERQNCKRKCIDLLSRSMHQRPGFLQRLINRLLGRRTDFPSGYSCAVEPWTDFDLCYEIFLAEPGGPLSIGSIGYDWYNEIYLSGLAFAGGALNLCELSEIPYWVTKSQDFDFWSCVPSSGAHGREARLRRMYVHRDADVRPSGSGWVFSP